MLRVAEVDHQILWQPGERKEFPPADSNVISSQIRSTTEAFVIRFSFSNVHDSDDDDYCFFTSIQNGDSRGRVETCYFEQ